jgi:hypothetical protein
MSPPRERTHTLTFPDCFEAMDGLALLVRHGYREFEGFAGTLVPRSARLVPGRSFGLRRGTVVLVWMD